MLLHMFERATIDKRTKRKKREGGITIISTLNLPSSLLIFATVIVEMRGGQLETAS
jgi:hypothetical protein